MAIESFAESKRATFQWRNFLTCFLLSFGLFVYGYDAGVIGTTLTKPSFLAYVHLVDKDGNVRHNATGLEGATIGLFQAGAFFGLLLNCWVQDKYGRKFAVIFTSTGCAISQGILAGSQNIAMFITLRFFTGFFSQMFLSLGPTYVSELSPSNLRGLYVGMCGIWCAMGYAVSTYFGTAFYNTQPFVQWRVPLALGAAWPLFILAGMFFVPESPRYLLMRGKSEQALAVVLQQHPRDNGEDWARAEFLQMQQQANLDVTMDSGWLNMINKPTYRKRAIIVVMILFTGQSSGNLVIQNYGGRLYSSLGHGVQAQLDLQSGYITTAVVFSIVGSLLVDRIGRRPLLLIGLGGCVVSIAIETAMVALFAEAGTNKAGLRMGVAALYMYIAFYCVSIDICCFIVSAELFPNHLRSKGTTLAFAACALTNLVFLQSAPSGFANIGWRFFLMFAIIGAFGVVYIYFQLPETRNIPLEEVADVIAGAEGETAIRTRDIQIDRSTHQVFVNTGRESYNEKADTTNATEKNEFEHTSTTEVA